MENITLVKKLTVKGIDFTIKTYLYSSSTFCSIISSEQGGIQLNPIYTGKDSLITHLTDISTRIDALAEIYTGWKDTIAILEEEGFNIQ